MKDRKTKLKIIAAIIAVVYYIEPVIQDMAYNYPEDKFNSHIVFGFPLSLYQSVKAIAAGTPIPIITQIIVLVITWLLLYFLLRIMFFKKVGN